jgi:hypothetical protein
VLQEKAAPMVTSARINSEMRTMDFFMGDPS